MKTAIFLLLPLLLVPLRGFAEDSYFFVADGDLDPSKISIRGDQLHIAMKIRKVSAPKVMSIFAYHQGLGPGREYQIQVNLTEEPAGDWIPMVKLGNRIFIDGISVSRPNAAGLASSFSIEGRDPREIRAWVAALVSLLKVPADKVHIDLKKVEPSAAPNDGLATPVDNAESSGGGRHR